MNRLQYTKRIQPKEILMETQSINFIRKGLAFWQKCATSFFFPDQFDRSYDRTVGEISIYDLYSFPEKRSQFSIFLHNRRKYLYDFQELQSSSIRQDSNYKYEIKYTLYKTIKPSTYENPCFNYSISKIFQSKQHCKVQCEKIQDKKIHRNGNHSDDFFQFKIHIL